MKVGTMDVRLCFVRTIFLHYFLQVSNGLNCYLCPRTAGETSEDSNIECLALGWDISCALDQDRCNSRWYENGLVIEKGCSRSEECVGTTSCCNGDYCNADAQSSKTGFGNPCTTENDCIQGETTMVCDKNTITDIQKLCLCNQDSYQRGATCKYKSYPDETCMTTDHCYDVNTTCVRQKCECADWMFPNGTKCDNQRHFGELCGASLECGGSNTACVDDHCACQFGYYVINGTNSCSHSPRVASSDWLLFTTSVMFAVFIQGK